jgi:hypothetical protein
VTAFQGSFDLRLPGVAGTDQQAADGLPERAPQLVAAREPRGVVYTRAWVVVQEGQRRLLDEHLVVVGGAAHERGQPRHGVADAAA